MANGDVDHEQSKIWNGASGLAWVEAQELLDQTFTPFERLLVDIAASAAARRILDVGCGTGTTTLALARHLGSAGRATGIDISEPMLTLARMRAEREGSRAEFVRADAQRHVFEPATFDLIVSRFGVMFFDDPVGAFANLRGAASAGAALRAIAWRSAAENPFMTVAERAAVPLLPDLPPRRADGPGQFAFASADRVRGILEASGWTEIEIRPLDVPCAFPATQLERYFTRLGPVGTALQGADAQTRTRIVESIRPAFDPFVDGAEIRFVAACWMVGATATPPKS